MIRLTLSFSWPEFGRFNVLMIDSLSLGPNLEIQVLITLGPIVCYLLPSFDDMIDGPLFNDSWPDFILMVELIDRLARFWIS